METNTFDSSINSKAEMNGRKSIESAFDAAETAAAKGTEVIHGAIDNFRDFATKRLESRVEMIRNNPLAAVGVALLAGASIGAIITLFASGAWRKTKEVGSTITDDVTKNYVAH